MLARKQVELDIRFDFFFFLGIDKEKRIVGEEGVWDGGGGREVMMVGGNGQEPSAPCECLCAVLAKKNKAFQWLGSDFNMEARQETGSLGVGWGDIFMSCQRGEKEISRQNKHFLMVDCKLYARRHPRSGCQSHLKTAVNTELGRACAEHKGFEPCTDIWTTGFPARGPEGHHSRHV